MFYSTQILSRKGPLATIWIAAHLEKRLKKSQIFETSIAQSVELVLNPEAPLALRLSGQLLLGIVRVYIRKLQLLEADAQDAIAGLQQLGSQVAGVEGRDAKVTEAAITLPLTDPMALFDPETGFFDGSIMALPTQSGGSWRSAASGSVSLTMVDDLSSQGWGSGSQGAGGWYDADAVFEGTAPGDEIDRRFSIELEMLRSQAAENPRAAAAAAQGALVFDPAGTMQDVGADDFLHSGGVDDGLMGLTPLKTPTSPGQLPLPGSLPSLGPASAGSLPRLPGSEAGTPATGLPGLEDTPAAAPDRTRTPPGSRDRPAARNQGAPRLRRKRAELDVGEDGKLKTELPGAEMRALLQDRSSLVRRRDAAGALAVAVSFGAGRRAGSGRGDGGLLDIAWTDGAGAGPFDDLFARALSVQAPRHELGGAEPSLVVEQEEGRHWEGPGARAATAAAASAGALGSDALQVWPTPGWETGLPTPDVGGYDDWGAGYDEPRTADAPVPPTTGAAPGLTHDDGDEALAPSETRRLSLTLQHTPGDSAGTSAVAAGTARTLAVLSAVHARFTTPDVGSKRRRGGANAMPAVSTAALLTGKPRREAAAWFFELLVLQNRGQLTLQQSEPYADISILRTEPGTTSA